MELSKTCFSSFISLECEVLDGLYHGSRPCLQLPFLPFCSSPLNNALSAPFESKEPWISTMILFMFYFIFQFHIAGILEKEPQEEKWELECSLSLLKLALITRASQHLTFWIWWLRAHKSKGWRAEETNSLSHPAPCPPVYTFFFFDTELPGIDTATGTSSEPSCRGWLPWLWKGL